MNKEFEKLKNIKNKEINKDNEVDAENNLIKKNPNDFDLAFIEKTILSIILNEQILAENINEDLFTNNQFKDIVKTIRHFSDQDKNGNFDLEAVGILISDRRKNDKWKTKIIPEIVDFTKGKKLILKNYLKILKEKQIIIKSEAISKEIITNVNKGNLDFLKKAANDLQNIDVFDNDKDIELKDSMDFSIYDLEEKIESDDEFPGIRTGIETLDDTIGGLQNSDLIILAARPGQGKTATAINFAYNSNEKCGFFSSEMPAQQVSYRLLSLDSGVNAQKLRNPKKLTKEEIEKLKVSAEKFKKSNNIIINDKSGISIQEIKETTKKWVEKYDIKFIIIDYLQRIKYKAPGSELIPKNQIVGEIATMAKEIARDFNIPVVGLAQLNRGAENKDDKNSKPLLSELKDSGNLEQEADLVICPWRSNTNGLNVNSDTEMLMLILKNRHGPLGEIPVLWRPKNMKIIDANSNSEDDEDSSNF